MSSASDRPLRCSLNVYLAGSGLAKLFPLV
jgi:hypothetical protein